MVECLTRDRGFEPNRRHYVVSLSKNINPSLVLVQPRKTCLFITERLLMGCKESNHTKTTTKVWVEKLYTCVFIFYMIVCTKKTISTALSILIISDGIAEVKQPSILSSLRENGQSQAWKLMLLRISE